MVAHLQELTQRLSNLPLLINQPRTSSDTQGGKLPSPFYLSDTNSYFSSADAFRPGLCSAQTQGEETISAPRVYHGGLRTCCAFSCGCSWAGCGSCCVCVPAPSPSCSQDMLLLPRELTHPSPS
uniref:Uncharacterized protein n=1 Tax=Apteryx owenii TaxID=8824 RepID=A0A8B9P7N3_APTOW